MVLVKMIFHNPGSKDIPYIDQPAPGCQKVSPEQWPQQLNRVVIGIYFHSVIQTVMTIVYQRSNDCLSNFPLALFSALIFFLQIRLGKMGLVPGPIQRPIAPDWFAPNFRSLITNVGWLLSVHIKPCVLSHLWQQFLPGSTLSWNEVNIGFINFRRLFAQFVPWISRIRNVLHRMIPSPDP